jgi:hypothetical protein
MIIYHHECDRLNSFFFLSLGWQDPEYRKCYTDIFKGNWEVKKKKKKKKKSFVSFHSTRWLILCSFFFSNRNTTLLMLRTVLKHVWTTITLPAVVPYSETSKVGSPCQILKRVLVLFVYVLF